MVSLVDLPLSFHFGGVALETKEPLPITLAHTSLPFGRVQSMVSAYFWSKEIKSLSDYSPRHLDPIGVDAVVHIPWTKFGVNDHSAEAGMVQYL